jgi:hypothetical protein
LFLKKNAFNFPRDRQRAAVFRSQSRKIFVSNELIVNFAPLYQPTTAASWL